MNGINYVVGVYVGKRRNQSVSQITQDPTQLVRMHIDKLSKLNVPLIKKATFVVSPSDDRVRDEKVVSFVNEYSVNIPNIQVDVFIGENNNGHSYGSWNFAMKKHINEGLHFFLIEDDYFPSRDEFYAPFIEKMSENTAYVSQLYCKFNEKHEHAAISNGIMNVNAALKHYDTFGECIFIDEEKKDWGGVWNQLHFLDNYKKMGFKMDDVSNKYFHPFLNPDNKIVFYGNENRETLIEPIFFDSLMKKILRKR